MRAGRLLIALMIAVAILMPVGARSRSRNRGQGQPGVFDYYVLSLSWSPQYCASNGTGDPGQCGGGRKFAFVVHGFWPQYEHGYPHDCAAGGSVSQEIISRMLPLMPNSKLIQHEWTKHGTCSGLSQDKYFETIEQVYSGVTIPPDFKAPLRNIEISPAKVKSEFVSANSAMPPDSFRVLCQGRFLSEVRICFTKDLHGRACAADVHDACSADSIIMRPVR